MDITYYKQYEPIFGVWYISRLIGEGSFGKVFELEREDFGVKYRAALKAITIPSSQSEIDDLMAEMTDSNSVRSYYSGFVKELVEESALMSRLKGNSNIVSYENHQVIEHKEGVGWDVLIQMELLTPLNQYIKEHTVTQQDVIKLGIDLCKALELCQKHNIIHRDIKPENIFVSDSGDFKLGDFGIARTIEKTTGGLSKKGTYNYMAPEVYKGSPYGSTVDLYSLGIVLYRLLNENRTPFLPPYPELITHRDRESALVKRFQGTPLPLPSNGRGRLGEIVLKACAYEPKERYSSPAQMRQELETVLQSQGKTAHVSEEAEGHSSTGGEGPSTHYDATQWDGETVSDFGRTTSGFGRTTSDFGRTTSDFGGTASAFGGAKKRAASGSSSGATKQATSGSSSGANTQTASGSASQAKKQTATGSAGETKNKTASYSYNPGAAQAKNAKKPQPEARGEKAKSAQPDAQTIAKRIDTGIMVQKMLMIVVWFFIYVCFAASVAVLFYSGEDVIARVPVFKVNRLARIIIYGVLSGIFTSVIHDCCVNGLEKVRKVGLVCMAVTGVSFLCAFYFSVNNTLCSAFPFFNHPVVFVLAPIAAYGACWFAAVKIAKDQDEKKARLVTMAAAFVPHILLGNIGMVLSEFARSISGWAVGMVPYVISASAGLLLAMAMTRFIRSRKNAWLLTWVCWMIFLLAAVWLVARLWSRGMHVIWIPGT